MIKQTVLKTQVFHNYKTETNKYTKASFQVNKLIAWKKNRLLKITF